MDDIHAVPRQDQRVQQRSFWKACLSGVVDRSLCYVAATVREYPISNTLLSYDNKGSFDSAGGSRRGGAQRRGCALVFGGTMCRMPRRVRNDQGSDPRGHRPYRGGGPESRKSYDHIQKQNTYLGITVFEIVCDIIGRVTESYSNSGNNSKCVYRRYCRFGGCAR